MCSPKSPKVPDPPKQEIIAAPTYANAEVQKAGQKVIQRTGSTTNRNIKTSAQGLGEEVQTKKQKLGE